MNPEAHVRTYLHQLVDRMDARRLRELLDLLDEELFTEAELSEIQELRQSADWTNWREV